MQTLPVTPMKRIPQLVTPGERIAVKAAIVRAADTGPPISTSRTSVSHLDPRRFPSIAACVREFRDYVN